VRDIFSRLHYYLFSPQSSSMKIIILPFVVCLSLTALSAAEKPNILVIVSDDQGYSDVGFQGCKDIPTPHLDRLAKEGLHCTNGYVSHPFCSPTRAGLMTGRYQHRFGHQNNPFYNPNDHQEGLPMSEKLLPEYLTNAGYATGWIGKWHLGAAPEFRPKKRGFAETFGFIGGGHKYQNWTANSKNEYTVPIERNGAPVAVTEHLTTAFGNEAADFIKRHQGKPWFLYLAFNAPHMPHEPTAERLARFASIKNPIRRNYAAQISLLDDAIGAAMESLRASGQEKNTLVFFFSDNGGPIGAGTNGSNNDPLRGGKGEVYDGGVRVPFVVKWPAAFPAGAKYDFPVSSLDVFASSLAVAGVTMPSDKKYDSVNLIPYLSGENKAAPHQQLFWARGPNMAVRDGDTKLVKIGPSQRSLFDLKTDISENTDIKDRSSAETKRLSDLLSAWDAEMVPPAFPGAKSAAKKPAPGK
jgi:arylsulfatase A-like enzyme